MSTPHQPPTQLLPGYTLIEHIGSGGYGEVWSASAPGDLVKAIKFVYGGQSEKRAEHERHALEKVKTVRHPFVLSLERIEVIDNRLLVVTELADGSVRDRFDACLATGLRGVPRDELLRYLSDAAEALDFLSTAHQLAHLDVKPENLLLLADRVKVADFGLVKSIGQTQASLVGGMTPVYAAPEVFKGAPERNSDQYSLAIVYQEMLTGAVPFPGENAAELTLQHMNHEPNLASLESGDRYAIARALAKDPNDRYASCRELVEALVNSEEGAGFDAAPSAGAPAAAPPRASRHSATEVFEEEEDAQTSGAAPILIAELEPAAAAADAGAAEFSAEGFAPSPALFVGVGGSAGHVLRCLRQGVAQQLGVDRPLATMPMLLLDTDQKSIAAANRNLDLGGGLTSEETMLLPLRRPQDYREKAELLLGWLSRRWLYNIPRSMQTDGIRPLGRLALMDHARQGFQRIRRAMTEAISEESLRGAEEATGIAFRPDALRVYVVGSISGGAGSGMLLDIAYAIRSIQARLGIEEVKLQGVLLHSTGREARRGELARVNAYSWLTEYAHLHSEGVAFPGDKCCGLPAREAGERAFDDTYLVNLGERLDNAALDAAAGEVADYLRLDTLTPTQRLLDACRAADRDDDRAATLRTFTVERRRATPQDERRRQEASVIDLLMRRWLERAEEPSDADPGTPATSQIVHGAAQFVSRHQLDATGLAGACRSALEARLGGDAQAYFASRQQTLQKLGRKPNPAAVEQALGVGLDEEGRLTVVDGQPVADLAQPVAERLTKALRDWICERANDPTERLLGADAATEWIGDHVTAVAKDVARQRQALDDELQGVVQHWKRFYTDSHDGAMMRLFRLRLDQASFEAAENTVGRLGVAVERFAEGLVSVRGLLEELRASIVEETSEALVVDGEPFEFQQSARWADALDKLIHNDHLATHGGLLGSLATKASAEELGASITHAARRLLGDRGQASSAEGLEKAGRSPSDGLPTPAWAEHGGHYWRAVAGPPAEESADNADGANAPNRVVLNDGDHYQLVEVGGVSIPHLAAEVIGRRRDYTELARRVHTRRDIDWTPLIPERVEDKDDPFAPADSSPPTSTPHATQSV
ncbi:tubulin-like doman-containing protein [Pseudobythopirellula maris]|uniref:tubulin-like doman-containing protein n=1 Tax=Pseudobythopirellula maris TaxID=2527991 RepID=UPI0018D3D05A|nr:tubulin-like doman-containing protein [Pseudobythopirellula maris]